MCECTIKKIQIDWIGGYIILSLGIDNLLYEV